MKTIELCGFSLAFGFVVTVVLAAFRQHNEAGAFRAMAKIISGQDPYEED